MARYEYGLYYFNIINAFLQFLQLCKIQVLILNKYLKSNVKLGRKKLYKTGVQT